MKNTVYITILLLAACQSPWRNDNSRDFDKLPSVDILLTDSSTVYHTTQVDQGKPGIIFYFSPDCEHCQDMTQYLLANLSQLEPITIVFISPASITDIRTFKTNYKLDKYDHIIVGNDFRYQAFNIFHFKAIPDIVIYNKQHQLTKLYSGEVTIDRITKALHS